MIRLRGRLAGLSSHAWDGTLLPCQLHYCWLFKLCRMLQGFQIWVDGLLMAQTDLNGGQPFANVSTIVLCGRSDLAPERFFDGKIAHFALYDQAIDNNTVRLQATTRTP